MRSRRRGQRTRGTSPRGASLARTSRETIASSTDGTGASTSIARSGSGSAPPLAYREDVEPLLLRAGLSQDTVLVGGQALNFWAEYYADRDDVLRANIPLTSADIDFVGRPPEPETLAAKLGGKLVVASLDHSTANYAVIRFTDHHGHERLIDFLEKICGVATADLRRTALRVSALDPELERRGLQLTIMQPVVCMESRLANTVEFEKYRDEHGLLQAKMSIRCARAFLLDLLDQGRSDVVRKLNERVFRFTKGQVARAAFARFQLDAFAAIVVDDRLPAQFRTVRYPQMRRYLERRRARHDDALP